MARVLLIVMRMTTSDEALALAAAGGDTQAFSALVSRHYDRLFRMAFRLTGAKVDAEDLTQDICAALPFKIRAFRGDARFTTWLYRVVLNAAHDRRRRADTHARAADAWGEVELARRAEISETAAALDWLTNALTKLPDDLRDTVALVMDEMTHAEAAHILDVSEGTISWRMSEVKKRLRDMKESLQ